jgi:hypothetical protein
LDSTIKHQRGDNKISLPDRTNSNSIYAQVAAKEIFLNPIQLQVTVVTLCRMPKLRLHPARARQRGYDIMPHTCKNKEENVSNKTHT